MNTVSLPYFEYINIQNLENEYVTEINFKGSIVNLFLNEMQLLETAQLNTIKSVLDDLEKQDKQNRNFIVQDFENHKNGSLSFEYLSYHLDELMDDFREMINPNQDKITNLKTLLKALKLQTISFYADAIIFDYGINDEISDQILALKMDYQQNVSLTWES